MTAYPLPTKALLTVLLLCTGCGPINLNTVAVQPAVGSVALTQGRVDVSHGCTPAVPPAPPLPGDWWRSVPVGQPPKMPGQGVAGFHLWRNTTGQCEEFRQDLYRTEFGYPLASLQRLKGLITKAEVTLFAAVLPAPRPNSLCQPMTGGGGSLFLLPPGATLPVADLTTLPHQQPFRTGGRLFAMTFPWVPGALGNGVTTQAVGGNRASFAVDVLARVNAAVNRADAAMVFTLSGADEALPTIPPPAGFDCRTIYEIGPMVVTHL